MFNDFTQNILGLQSYSDGLMQQQFMQTQMLIHRLAEGPHIEVKAEKTINSKKLLLLEDV